jgi:hypothetical protein
MLRRPLHIHSPRVVKENVMRVARRSAIMDGSSRKPDVYPVAKICSLEMGSLPLLFNPLQRQQSRGTSGP